MYRKRFYRDLGGTERTGEDEKVPIEQIREFWSTMWDEDPEQRDFSGYLKEFDPGIEEPIGFPSRKEFGDMIQRLPNWKAAGCDRVYNYFIKQMTGLHDHIYRLVKEVCLEGREEDDWFYKGLTILIPKGKATSGSEFRPITCMPTLYKLTTKCVTEMLQLEVERRGLLAENQLGTVRRVQGAKEQALLNIAVNKQYGNSLKAMWVDVKKAFDSVSHTYLLACLRHLGLANWILRFLETTISHWRIKALAYGESVLEKQVKRGILQGDSLSPLLFVLCMDPLSRALSGKYPKVSVPTGGPVDYTTNHLLFIDDLKLLSESEEVLIEMSDETQRFFRAVGLEMNREKSATNIPECQQVATLLEGTQGYKYLGIIEDPSGFR